MPGLPVGDGGARWRKEGKGKELKHSDGYEVKK